MSSRSSSRSPSVDRGSRHSSSRSRSRTPSSRGSSPRSGGRSPSRTPSPVASNSGHHSTASTKEDVPTDAEIVLRCIQDGDLAALQRACGWEPESDEEAAPGDEAQVESLLSAPLHPRNGVMSGENAVFFAAYLNRRAMLAYMARFVCVSERLMKPVLLQMHAFQRYAILFFIGTLSPNLLVDPLDDTGSTLLMMACRRRKTPTAFVDELMKIVPGTAGVPLAAYLNVQNAAGDTALHVVARESKGKDGEVAARSLILHGASEDLVNAKGQNPRAAAINPFIRDLLGLGRGPKPRPLPTIDEASKAEIDKCKDSDHFPAVKPIEVPPTDPVLLVSASPLNADTDPGAIGKNKKKTKKLGSDEVEALSMRLSVHSVQQREKWLESKLSVIEERDRSRGRILSSEEVQAATERLHDDELAMRDEKKEAVRSKYIRPPPESPQLALDDLEASAQRLGGKTALSHRQQVKAKLNDKYSPPRARKRISKEQMAASAARLHDESAGHSQQTHAVLYEKYCPKKDFGKLNKAGQAEMADRLSAPIRH